MHNMCQYKVILQLLELCKLTKMIICIASLKQNIQGTTKTTVSTSLA